MDKVLSRRMKWNMPVVVSLGMAHGASPFQGALVLSGSTTTSLLFLFSPSVCRVLLLAHCSCVASVRYRGTAEQLPAKQGQLLAKQAKSAVITFPESFVPTQEHSLVRTFRSPTHATACFWFGTQCYCTTFTTSPQKALCIACCTSCKKPEILHRRVRKYRSKYSLSVLSFSAVLIPSPRLKKDSIPRTPVADQQDPLIHLGGFGWIRNGPKVSCSRAHQSPGIHGHG